MNQKAAEVLDRLREAVPKLSDQDLDRLAAFIDGLTFRIDRGGKKSGRRKAND